MSGQPGSAAVPAVGYYGKLPSRGDFLTQRLAAAFVAAWDDWLQAGMVASKAALGEAWLDAYLSAPLWRFQLPAGVAGPNAMIGMTMPSVDRAGRYFPLTLAATLPGEPALGRCFSCSSWFARLEKAALHALDDGVALEEFEAGVAALAGPPAERAPEAEDWAEGATRVVLARDDLDPMAPFAAFAASSIHDGRCVFWTLGSPRVAPAALLLGGLPPAQRFASMLDDALPQQAEPAAATPAPETPSPEFPPLESPPPLANPPLAAPPTDTPA